MKIGISNFIPERLTQARESLGLTKAALSQLINISPATITNWEKGSQLPTEEKLRTLSDKLDFQTHWFLKETKTLEESTPYFYRSLSAATKTSRSVAKIKLNWLNEITETLEEWLDWPQVNIPSISETQFLKITDQEIEEIASECRETWALGNGPIDNIAQTLESAGVILTKVLVGTSKMDGVSKWNEEHKRPYMLIASDKENGIRNRFDMAHELGHLVLHRNVSNENFTKYYKEIERQANYFAGCFLIPAESFASELPWPSLESMLAMKKRWKVSISAMIMRSYQLELIDDDQKLRLYKGRSARGWTKSEPYDLEAPKEAPKLLSRAIQMLLENNLVTKADISLKLGFSDKIIEEICYLPNGFFSKTQQANSSDNVINFKDYLK